MFLDTFYSLDDGYMVITPEQASRFAKDVAGDYNHIHDPNARRFCVPGDLLFALVLNRFGLSQQMGFRFHSMVGRQARLLVQENDGKLQVVDHEGKLCLEATCEGENTQEAAVIEAFTRRYVAFSGLNFPHYLKPLLKKHGVMFSPERPLVIYDSMGFELSSLAVEGCDLELAGSDMRVEGKRAEAFLEFKITDDGHVVGRGSKKLIVSGLRPYESDVMAATIAEYDRLKDVHKDPT